MFMGWDVGESLLKFINTRNELPMLTISDPFWAVAYKIYRRCGRKSNLATWDYRHYTLAEELQLYPDLTLKKANPTVQQSETV